MLMRDGSLFAQDSTGLSYQMLAPCVTAQKIAAMLSDGTYGSMGTATLHITWAGSTVSWYATATGYYVTPYAQANLEGQVYRYLAIG